jgi:transposase InsO family protein
MQTHRNAKLGLAGRYALVGAIEAGMSLKQAAACFNVAPATAHRWWHRWRQSTGEARATLACLLDRPSRPKRSPRLTPSPLAEAICEARRRTGWGPRLIAVAVGAAHATVWKVLRRAGLSRPARPERQPANRYEWPCPGDLLHMDTTSYARFQRPGHAVTGQRRMTTSERADLLGYDVCHAVVDDHSRLAYAELLADARAATVTAFLERALAFYERHGVSVKRLMSDNAWAYSRNRSLRQLVAKRGIRHLLTRPYRPRTNGKVERFHQTMAREWAYGLVYPSSQHRAQALPYWLDHYNRSRPHSSLGGDPPISRIHNVHRQDS